MKVPVVVMRGGTSKGVFLNFEHMPSNRSLWEDFLLDVMGSPDRRQIDGLGGANSLTSKAAIIKKSESPEFDVEYTFAQISIDNQMVDFKGNCGNISSAVGPYAIEQGLVPIQEPVTTVKIFNVNTQKLIIAEVEVENGHVKSEGCCSIPGVPGKGSPIYLSFTRAEGAVTGKLFPTGNPIDMIKTKDRLIQVSIIDVANPLVFVRAQDIGLSGTELPNDYSQEKLIELEEIRSIAAEMCQFSDKKSATLKSPAVPKMTLIAPPMDYVDLNGSERKASEMDLMIRMMSMQKPHQALAITGAICATAGAYLQETVLSEMVNIKHEIFRLAHPAGIMETKVDFLAGHIRAIKVVRTARIILEGYVYTKKNYENSYQLA
ncbi:PrpF domain-containing protein [Peribacillus frigoritolerans]|uniref:2-methylaconitate cis-trans isomerase PrpF family protein n=1 Tax=Peribacillus frigoritolerans TaxID=450367 RepID=UPI000FDA404D|nr:PrpF domain-containing protein [Peribacillus frigoritolerans]AZV60176.1 3-methylitaconate isomerase [Peribacillus frigoritolerans]USK82272.1 3-methylitaconate isomerase [Peribacillus frigoritolerans]WJE49571.1 PrpF domain-containing protein [Peribacillus frigoritolerans]